MLPGLRPGSVVVAWGAHADIGDIVIARQGGREVVKRLTEIRDARYFVEGDNREESTDSREFGPVKKEDILGVVMITLPVAVDPPKVRTAYAVLAGWIAAGILIISALIHLFRIDTFLPLLDEALPGGYTFAAFAGAVIVISEVFAVPFVLRMKLSPLMQLKSGFLMVFAPLVWLLIGIWCFGYPQSTAQFGEFLNTPSTIPLVMLNIAWLSFNFWTLWLLNYDVAVRGITRKSKN
jgi:hypothetical protein